MNKNRIFDFIGVGNATTLSLFSPTLYSVGAVSNRDKTPFPVGAVSKFNIIDTDLFFIKIKT